MIAQRDRLDRVLGRHKIQRLIFLFPRHDSAEVNAHLRKQEKVLRAAVSEFSIDSIASDVVLAAWSVPPYLKAEQEELDRVGAARTPLPSVSVSAEDVESFRREAAEQLIDTLEKLERRFGEGRAPDVLDLALEDKLVGDEQERFLEQRPSAAAIREQLIVEDRIRRAEGLGGEMAGLLDELEPLSLDYRKVKAELRDLEEGDLSDHDRNRLNEFGRSFLGQLAEYGFRSLDGVTLSEETYLPERDGFDLTHEVSASDTIRLIWAYLLGLMEAGAEQTNHPGFLVLDEPGQLEVEGESLRSFLNRAAKARERHQQVLVTVTREVSQTDREELADAKVVDFGRRQHVLQPLDD